MVGDEIQQASDLALASFPDEKCKDTLEPGPCRDYVVKWYYDRNANACARFWYGGCGGNRNQFESEKTCKKACVGG